MSGHLKFTSIAHRDHLFHSPLSEEKVDRVLSLIDLPRGDVSSMPAVARRSC